MSAVTLQVAAAAPAALTAIQSSIAAGQGSLDGATASEVTATFTPHGPADRVEAVRESTPEAFVKVTVDLQPSGGSTLLTFRASTPYYMVTSLGLVDTTVAALVQTVDAAVKAIASGRQPPHYWPA